MVSPMNVPETTEIPQAVAEENAPDRENVNVRGLFGIDSNLTVSRFTRATAQVPTLDASYQFDRSTTLAILAGFTHKSRVLVQGMHGTGKSTHIEQVAARLRWPVMRVNLDGQLSRLDLVGKDAVVLRDGQPMTVFQEGVLPWAMSQPMALILDEYDAGRPDVMFVIQRLLEQDGALVLPDQNRVIRPHPDFRLFATANTVGLGNLTGLYHGVQRLNHAQLDRWNVVASLNYLPAEQELDIVASRVPHLAARNAGRTLIERMIELAALTRQGFAAGDLSTLMSPRTVITWAQNIEIFQDPALAFRLSFLNKCDDAERPLLAEYYQRCFDADLAESLDSSDLVA